MSTVSRAGSEDPARGVRPLFRQLALAGVVTCFAFLAFSPTHADDAKPFLHPLFADNMVLQRDAADPIWGWTTPARSVTVAIGGKTVTATAGQDGKWMAKVGPFPAGGPYTLTITGPQSQTLRNVMFGDVWLCTGQSNMEYGVSNLPDSGATISVANYPNLRLMNVLDTTADTPQATPKVDPWGLCTPPEIARRGTGGFHGFTAVGYFFGSELVRNTKVPIGLIETNWGGTPAEAWTSKEALVEKVPMFTPMIALSDIPAAGQPTHAPMMAAWYAKYDRGQSGNWQAADLSDTAWSNIAVPGFFQDAGIDELKNINGIVWFRKTFDLPAADTGKDAALHLLVDDNDTTWINGVQVGATEGYQTPRSYTVAASLLKPTGNVIAVRVLDTGGKGGIYGDPASLVLNVPGGNDIPLSGQWRYNISYPYDNGSGWSPTVLYNAMIAPLFPFAIKGAIWYQGESNAQSSTRAIQYRTLLPAMIGCWRAGFHEGNFPFLIVQLAGFQPGGDTWPTLRQSQWITAKTAPNSGIATAVDVGEQWNIHPGNKMEVGRRLALVAEAKVYHEPVEYSGPVYKSVTIGGNAAILTFDHAGGGLTAKDGKPLTGFEIAGADGKYVTADAKIAGDTIVVSSPQIPAPTAVRYAWAAYPECSLYNKSGLPAFPFDTRER